MAYGYFSYFPKILYNLDNSATNNFKTVTNILARSNFLKEIIDNTSIYYEYQMKDTDTPEIIADKLYGDPNRHWIILLFNKITNPQYEFPLEPVALENYIQNKYSQTIEQSQAAIHHYELRVTKKESYNGFVTDEKIEKYTVSDKTVNFTTGALGNRSVPGTADTYIDQGTETFNMGGGKVITINQRVYAISNYTYEIELNEDRRNIRLLDKLYINQIENEFRGLMSNG